MAYNAPILHGNPDEPSLVTAEQSRRIADKKLKKKINYPKGCLLLFDSGMLKAFGREKKLEKIDHILTDLFRFRQSGVPLAIIASGIGAPGACAVVEGLIARGFSHFIAVGTAGALQRKMKFGETVLCTHAVREEGTSYHYASPSTHAYADPVLTNQLAGVLAKKKLVFRRGVSWTTDAPYRETRSKVRHHRKEGVLAVEMEAAALFTVADVRRVKLAACFAISDSLSELKWETGFDSKELKTAIPALLKAAAEALAAAVKK
jgi:uridine phosphorylase